MWIYTFQGEGQVASSATSYQYERDMDFPGGPVVKHVPANAGDTGLIPGLGRSHARGQLSPCAVTTEAACPRASALQQEKPP